MLSKWEIRQGDVRQLIVDQPPASIDCVITSPPFWRVRDFGHDDQIGMEDTLNGFLDDLIGVFAAIRPVLKSTATVWVEFGDAHNNGFIGRTDKAFLQTRNQAIPVNVDVGKKSLIGAPWRFATRMIDAGWILRNVVVWQRPAPVPEAVLDRLTHSWTPVFLFANTPRYYFNLDEIRVPTARQNTASWQDVVRNKTAGLDVGLHETSAWRRAGYVGNDAGRNPGDVWSIPPDRLTIKDSDHTARFPEALVAMCLLAGCPRHVCGSCGSVPVPSRKGLRLSCACGTGADMTPGTVFDPFCGSGTVPAVALRYGYHALGYDLLEDYCVLSRKRCMIAAEQPAIDLRRNEQVRPVQGSFLAGYGEDD